MPAPAAQARGLVRDRFLRAALLLSLVGFLHGLVYIPFGYHATPDSSTYIAAAKTLLHGSYSTPLEASFESEGVDRTALKIAPEAWHALERQTFRLPGYPLVLAAVGGGEPGVSRAVLFVLQTLMLGSTTLLVALTLRRWLGPRVALVGAGVYALDPYTHHYASLVLTEATAALAAALGVYAFTRAWQQRSLRWWVVSGLAAGALTLVRPIYVLALPLLVIAVLVREPGARVRAAAATGIAGLALLAPWLAWNASVLGQLKLTSWGSGYGFLVAAHGEGVRRSTSEVVNDDAFERDVASVFRFAPTTARLVRDPEAHPRYLARADTKERRLAFRLYRKRLRSEPGEVVREVLERSYLVWVVHNDWRKPAGGIVLLGMRLADWIVLLLAGLGSLIALVRGGPARGFVLFLLAYTLSLGVQHSEARFSIPLRGFYIGLASFGALELLGVVRVRLGRSRAGLRGAS